MRHEFSAKTKRLALERAGGVCEATGTRYGLAPGERCTAILSQTGVQHDHYPLGAHAEGSNTLENDVVCCPYHNQYAANHTDKQTEQRIKNLSYEEALHQAKMQRKAGMDVPDPPKPRGKQSRVAAIPKPKNHKWPSRPFEKRKR